MPSVRSACVVRTPDSMVVSHIILSSRVWLRSPSWGLLVLVGFRMPPSQPVVRPLFASGASTLLPPWVRVLCACQAFASWLGSLTVLEASELRTY